MPTSNQKPNWDHWLKMTVVSLKDAVILSFDEDPYNSSYSLDLKMVFGHPEQSNLLGIRLTKIEEEMRERYLEADSALDQQNGIKNRTTLSSKKLVSLGDFGTWALRNDYNLPTRYPVNESHYGKGTFVLDFPYEVPLLRIIRTVMFKHFNDPNPIKHSQHKLVTDDVFHMFGQKNLSLAKGLVGLIKPTQSNLISKENK